ncbi:hypothetical protein TNCT_347861 [Trichonephila clavata]|uniref:Uncharacterized protein n=1 Tax=Trichonephila clavata TaxID=2740835 RepID=A0A8X6HXR6_TRICU|nr:hypothetical protein TNCT_347861 [Trichonephila clavata]
MSPIQRKGFVYSSSTSSTHRWTSKLTSIEQPSKATFDNDGQRYDATLPCGMTFHTCCQIEPFTTPMPDSYAMTRKNICLEREFLAFQ